MVWFAQQSNVLDFLHKVSRDEGLQEALKRNPRGVMQEAGLSEEEIRLLHDGDHEGVLGTLLNRVEDD